MPRPESPVPAVDKPTESTFESRGKSYPLLILPNASNPTKPGFQFGVSKAVSILRHVPEIKAFVDKHSKPAAAGDVSAKLSALEELLRKLGAPEEEILAAKGE